MRGVTFGQFQLRGLFTISTHTPHARRDAQNGIIENLEAISTHTPHARRDKIPFAACTIPFHFYSHASCEA